MITWLREDPVKALRCERRGGVETVDAGEGEPGLDSQAARAGKTDAMTH